MVDYVKTAGFGARFGAFLYLLGWLIGWFAKNGGSPQATLDFIPTLAEGAKTNIQTLPTDLASKILAWISGISPFDFMGLIVMVITGAIVAVVGAFFVNWIKNTGVGRFINKTEVRQITGIIVIGSVIITGLLSVFAGNPQLPALWATITMVIYFAVFALAYKGLQKLFPALEKKILTSP